MIVAQGTLFPGCSALPSITHATRSPTANRLRTCFRPISASVRRRLYVCRAAEANSSTAEQSVKAESVSAKTATEAVEKGLTLFEKGEVNGALEAFQFALKLSPNEDEARAALYNSACCYTKLKQWQPAVDSVMSAVNDYDLKLTVALKDKDLDALRDRREWLEALSQLKGGLSDEAYVQLRSEAKAPFRTARLILCGGLLLGASVGLLIIVTRLVAALAGAPNAPELTETLQNLGINTAAVAILGTIVFRDVKGIQKDQQVVDREESLAKLQIEIDNDRQLPLASFRGVCRPVLIVGSRGHINRCLKAAEPVYDELRSRGVSVVPLEINADDPSLKLKALKDEFSGVGSSKGFGGTKRKEKSDSAAAAIVTRSDRKWRLQAYDVDEWLQWVKTQKDAAKVTGENVWVQVQLDGTVRSSGVGTPPWAKFVVDLPELEDVRTKFTDGIGRL